MTSPRWYRDERENDSILPEKNRFELPVLFSLRLLTCKAPKDLEWSGTSTVFDPPNLAGSGSVCSGSLGHHRSGSSPWIPLSCCVYTSVGLEDGPKGLQIVLKLSNI